MDEMHMSGAEQITRILYRIGALIVLLLCSSAATRADLDAYIKRPEPAYKWEKRGEQKLQGGTVYDLHLVSQTWQGIVWEHRLQIFMPDHAEVPEFLYAAEYRRQWRGAGRYPRSGGLQCHRRAICNSL